MCGRLPLLRSPTVRPLRGRSSRRERGLLAGAFMGSPWGLPAARCRYTFGDAADMAMLQMAMLRMAMMRMAMMRMAMMRVAMMRVAILVKAMLVMAMLRMAMLMRAM